MRIIALLGFLALSLSGQTQDTSPRNIAHGTSNPATCSVADVFFRTDATAGQNWYLCTGTNTWTQAAGGGGGGGGSVFTGSIATATTGITGTATNPIFSCADQSVKSPVLFQFTMSANVASVTFNNCGSGAMMKVRWIENGTGGWTLTHGSSATSTCETAMDTSANIWTEQPYEVQADGTTILGGVCSSNSKALRLPGSSSGITVLQPAAAASGTLTLPATTDTLVGKATTDTLTNKTYDTAGTGNSFKINGTAISSVSGTGAVCLATGSSCGGGSISNAPGCWLGPQSSYTTNGTDSVQLSGGAGNGGLFEYFVTVPCAGSKFNYQIITAAAGGRGALFGVFSADGLFTKLCISSVATGADTTTTGGARSITWASGSNVSGGICTLSGGGYLLGSTSDDSGMATLATQTGFGITKIQNVNEGYYAAVQTGVSTGAAGSLAFVSSATLAGFTYSTLTDVRVPIVFMDK